MVEQLVEVPTILSYSLLQPTLFGEAFRLFSRTRFKSV